MRNVNITLVVLVLTIAFIPSRASAQAREYGERPASDSAALFQERKKPEDLRQVIRKYKEEALAIRRDLKDLKGEANTLANLGGVYFHWGLNDKGAERYEKALPIFRYVKDPRGEASALNRLGSLHANWGQNDKAVTYYEKALAINRDLKNPKGEAPGLKSLGRVYRTWGQLDKALEYYEMSLEILRDLKDPSAKANAFSNLANLFSDWGQYDKAVQYFQKSLAIFRELKDPDGEGQVLNNLGLVYEGWGQYDKALAYLERALAMATDLRDPRSRAGALNNLGNLYHKWGRHDNALECYGKSLTIRKELKDPKGEAISVGGLASVYQVWGQYGKALEYYQKALIIRQGLRDRHSEADTLIDIGYVYSQMGELRNALTQVQKGFAIHREIGVPTKSAQHTIGDLYLDMGELDKAEHLLQEADATESLGRAHLLKADFPRAAEYYEKVRATAEQTRNVYNLFAGYTGLGIAYEGIGNLTLAEENYRKAVDLTEDMRSGLNAQQREKFFDVKVAGFRRTEPYDGLARVRLRIQKAPEALKVSEFTKARIFAESISRWSDKGGFNISQDILSQDRELNDQLAALKKKRQEAYEKADQAVIAVMEPQVKAMEVKLQIHVKMLRESYPLFAATKYPQPMDLDQTALKEDEWVLAYHVTEPGLIMYLTNGKKILKAGFKALPRLELTKLVTAFRTPLDIVPGKNNFDEKLKSFDFVTAKKLADVLLADVLNVLPRGASLTVVPDDCLGVIPFEMLVLNDKGTVKTDKDLPYVSGAEFFGDRNLISYCQSVTALTLSRIHAKSKGTQAGLLAIADPVFQEKDERAAGAPKKDAPTGVLASLFKRLNLMAAEEDGLMGGLKFPRLSLTSELAQALAGLHRGHSHICTGFAATKSDFLDKISPSLRQYDSVVFATHGYFGKDLPGIMEPVLVLTLIPLGTDGYLRMTEVMGLNMNADIVALTACQTGVGKRTAGEGTMGMGRAFQYAGARSVLMSLWSVSEVASVRLVKSFFRHMKGGKNKTEALALARTELRSKGFDHPFFWAGFILVGEAN